MNLETSTEMLLHDDGRLLPAIQPVIIHASAHAGLSEAGVQDLADAAADACKEALSLAGKNGNTDPVVKVTINSFADRVEVAIEHKGESCANHGRRNVDRVDCDVRGGISRTVLVKYSAASKFEHRS